jgi:hypothetical protein
MAKRTVVELIDDLDGESEAAETVNFALDGSDYEIDLTDAHAKQLRAALGPFLTAGRKSASVGRTPRRGRTKTSASAAPARGPSPEDIRAWAKSQKLQVSERGRIKRYSSTSL